MSSAWRRGLIAGQIAWAALGCAGAPVEPTTKVAYGPLKDVILLPLTTRSSEGLLGHVLREDGVTPDRSRTIFHGTPRLSTTAQRVTVVRELSADARVSAGYGPLRVEGSEGSVTHLAYIVEVTGYAEVSPSGQYVSESDCCFNGVADLACEQGFVLRLVRGSGVVKYLQRAHQSGRVKASQYFETKLGERFLVVDESSFRDAFFAFEPGDMKRLCATLPDEATFEPASVVANPNCSVMAYDRRGANHHFTRYLPDEVTCRTVGAEFCATSPDTVRCVASFAGRPFTLEHETPAAPGAGLVAPARASAPVPASALPTAAADGPAGDATTPGH